MGRMKRSHKKAVGGRSSTSHAVAQVYRKEGREAAGRVAPKQITFDVDTESSFFGHFFDCGRGDQQEEQVFAPVFCSAVTAEKGQLERWIGMSTCSRYDGPGMAQIGRPTLNLVFVLDKSGSMSSRFTGDPKADKSKIQVAKDAIMFLTTKLRPEDSFGIVTFDRKATTIQPLTVWKDTDADDLRKRVNQIDAGGGTTITAGMNMAKGMVDNAGTEIAGGNRLFFFTDMQVSARDGQQFTDLIAENAEQGIFATIYGVGMDLKAEIYERISKTKGCNYGNVRTQAGFQEQVDQEFSYTVTPIAFDVTIDVISDGHSFSKAYGSPEVRSVKSHETVRLSTVFPSYQDENYESRSGIFLFKVGSNKGTGPVQIRTAWKDEHGKPSEVISDVDIPGERKDDDADYFETAGMRKAVLLVRYTQFISIYLQTRVSQDVAKYEQYRREYPKFVAYFRREMGMLNDNKLKTEELKHLLELAEQDDIPLDDSVLAAGESYSEEKTEASPAPKSAPGAPAVKISKNCVPEPPQGIFKDRNGRTYKGNFITGEIQDVTLEKTKDKVDDWSVDDVGTWLKSLGAAFNQYVQPFKDTGITGKILKGLGQDDLKQLISNTLHLKVVTENLSQVAPGESAQIEGH